MAELDGVRFGRLGNATPPGGLAAPVEVTHAGTVAGDGSGAPAEVPASPPESRSPGLVRTVGYVRASPQEQAVGDAVSWQRQAIVDEVGRRGWELVDVVGETASGKSLHRAGLDYALRLLADGEAGSLVVARLDRLSLSVPHVGHLLGRAEREGWRLVVVNFEPDTLGGPVGRPRAVPAEVVARMVAWRAEGVLSPAIADRLNGEGVATAHGAPAWSARAVRDVLARAERE